MTTGCGRMALSVQQAIQVLWFAYFPLSCAQIHRTLSPPQYTPMHYVLMVTSVILLLSLVLGLLVLVRKHSGRCGGAQQRSRRQLIRVQPSPQRRVVVAAKDDDDDDFADGDLVIEDLVDGQWSVECGGKRVHQPKPPPR